MVAGHLLTGFVLGLLVLVSTELYAESKPEDAKATSTKTINSINNFVKVTANTLNTGKFVYQPPRRGAPAVRIGGGTRGIGDQTLELVVFAPDHTGLTTKEQPTLYWYASEPVLSKLELTIINDKDIDPELEQMVAKTSTAGIQSIDLAKTKTRLIAGLEYRWFVSAVADKAQRSNDIVASGTIQRIIPDTELKKSIATADDSALITIYTKEGIWYDAIDSLTQMARKHPENADLHEQHAAILEQVGLQSAADYVRKK